MKPGTITAVSAGTLQGVFRPQARIYYSNAKHGICCETISKKLRCRSRKRAVELAREWINTPEFAAELEVVKNRIAANPENQI